MKVADPPWSAGMGFAFIHLPQAYWKKSAQGSRDLSAWSGLKPSRAGKGSVDGGSE